MWLVTAALQLRRHKRVLHVLHKPIVMLIQKLDVDGG